MNSKIQVKKEVIGITAFMFCASFVFVTLLNNAFMKTDNLSEPRPSFWLELIGFSLINAVFTYAAASYVMKRYHGLSIRWNFVVVNAVLFLAVLLSFSLTIPLSGSAAKMDLLHILLAIIGTSAGCFLMAAVFFNVLLIFWLIAGRFIPLLFKQPPA